MYSTTKHKKSQKFWDKDDKPVGVVTDGDKLSFQERARIRTHLGEILGIPLSKQNFDIPDSNDLNTELAIVDMLRYSIEHADRNLAYNTTCSLQVVAEGRVHLIDPQQMVHFVRLGSNAARVWVDVVKVDDAKVWRLSDEIEYMKDALGSSIAWPMDKLVVF